MSTRILLLTLFLALTASVALAQALFVPTGANTTITCDTDGESAALTAAGRSLRVHNTGAAKVFVALGGEAVAATDADMSFPPDSVDVIGLARSQTHVACITSSGTALVHFKPGNGF